MTSDPRRRRTLQRYAIAISIFSVFYNTAEGVVSIVSGAGSSSRALVFYGLQSIVEVISVILVTWCIIDVVRPGDEQRTNTSSPHVIRIERIVTTTIGALLVALAFAAFGTSTTALVARERLSTDLPTLMLVLYLAKRLLARALDSSGANNEAFEGGCCESCHPRYKGAPAKETQKVVSEQKLSPSSLSTQCCGENSKKKD